MRQEKDYASFLLVTDWMIKHVLGVNSIPVITYARASTFLS
jgi:hypothetical protein